MSDKENQMLRSNLARQSQPNPLQLTNQNGSNEHQPSQFNKYKRTQQQSHQSLANYQQKYERLEKNFKKFSNNIKHAKQSEAVIEGLKYKTALSLLDQMSKKADFGDARRAFQVWRLNSGVAFKQYENQEKTLIMAKCAQKMS